LLTISGLSKAFDGALALKAISATVSPGEIVGVVGPDGAGKTTLMRLIAALLLPTEGQILVGGYDTVTQAAAIAPLIGYMPQKFGLYEDLTVMQNLMLYADLKGLQGRAQESAFTRLLDFTALQPFTARLAGALSGGMKQKLGLACALLGSPTLLLLDEPSVGVDPISRRELWKMVFELLKQGISVMWSTAYLDEAERCHSVLLLNEGLLIYQGAPRALSQRVAGRTFKLTKIHTSRRAVLERALNDPQIVDGVIQGSDVRIVIKEKNGDSLDLKELGAGQHIELIPTEPRFEDAFVDLLGGGPGGRSKLAEGMNVRGHNHSTMIDASALTKKFGTFVAASDITFSVPRGEIFGLLGPNGAGKSTTFKMLCGLLMPTSGKALVLDYDLEQAPAKARQQIGYMAQKFSLYSELSVQQNLQFFSGIYNLVGKERKRIIAKMIEIFNLDGYLAALTKDLPLGFKQRLALACAVMHDPEVLFLDEPTSGVDPITRREFWTHINGLVEKGVTVMITTHFMDEAEYCDRIALVYRGKIIQMASPDALKNLAVSAGNQTPTLEDAFIQLIEAYDRQHPLLSSQG
jgi:ABC-2 type transport system ATP-binding protein